jgi:hypothetical protein
MEIHIQDYPVRQEYPERIPCLNSELNLVKKYVETNAPSGVNSVIVQVFMSSRKQEGPFTYSAQYEKGHNLKFSSRDLVAKASS